MTLEDLEFMKTQGSALGLSEHVCAEQHERHAYTAAAAAKVTQFMTIDGTEVFCDGIAIDPKRTFTNAHYGSCGQSYGFPERERILETIQKRYLEFYRTKADAAEKPDVLKAVHTYCGN